MNFNAAKSMCMVVLPSCRRYLAPLLSKCAFNVGGSSMKIVSSYCHLGHIISSSLSDEQDIMSRRNAFIGQVNSVYVTSGNFLLLLKPGCFIHTVQVITAVSYGTCPVVLWMISA